MLQWADTFNKYGTSTALMLNGLYAEVNGCTLVADIDPTSTQYVLCHSPNVAANEGFRRVFSGGSATTMGFKERIWLVNLPQTAGLQPAWEFRDSANVAQVSILINTTGTISAVRGTSVSGGGTVLGTSAVPVVVANAYNDIEAKVTIDDAAGAVEVRVNGVTVLTVTGADTKATAIAGTAQIAYVARGSGGAGGAPTTYQKDFAIWDTTGTYNNNFMGTVSVIDRDTVSDVALTWTPSTGSTGWSILDNNPPVDTIYVGAATALSNTFGLQDLPADVTSVRGLILVNRSWKIDGGDGNVQMGIISGASTGLGTDRPVTTAPTYWYDVMEVDPATGVPFTPSGFNAANLKQSRTL